MGKTELCLSLAKHYACDIINADSRQIFKEIPIGTAAPSAAQQQMVRHYFVGTHSVEDYYSASEYEQDVLRLVEDLSCTNNLAILTGGSMMYIDAVCNGIDELPTVPDNLRNELKQRLADEGIEAISEELHRLDPEYWEIVDRQNPRRLLHALEICLLTGKTYTSLRVGERKRRPFRVIKIGLNRPREELFGRINQRVLQMMDDGFLEEARRLYPLRHLNALNTVGYKELFSYLSDEMPLALAIVKIQTNTRRYAKKQLTWYKRDTEMRWFLPDNSKEIINYIDSLLSKCS